MEQNSGFKLERNKDLTFIVIIIDTDWYEKNDRDNFLGHVAQPYIRDARYTGTGKVPVYIIFQTVRYHNFAQFGISYAAVAKYTCRFPKLLFNR